MGPPFNWTLTQLPLPDKLKMISAGDLYIGTAWLQLKCTISIYDQAYHHKGVNSQ